MTTSISSKVFSSITDRQTDKIFTEQMLIYEGNLHKKIGAISQLGAEKITFSHRQTDRQTDGHLLLQSSLDTNNLQYIPIRQGQTVQQVKGYLDLNYCRQPTSFKFQDRGLKVLTAHTNELCLFWGKSIPPYYQYTQ